MCGKMTKSAAIAIMVTYTWVLHDEDVDKVTPKEEEMFTSLGNDIVSRDISTGQGVQFVTGYSR